MSRVLVVSPHPDDEAIGCGGTLCAHAAAGDEVRALFLTSGEMGGHGRTPDATRLVREREAVRAARILGIERVEFWRLPDGRLQISAGLVARLRQLVREWRPHVVYTTHAREAHRDHRAANRLVRTITVGERVRMQVFQFEVWTPIARIDHIVDISAWMRRKLRAVRAYRSQCDVVGFEAAVKGLNRYRGELHSWPGGDYAEVFEKLQ